MKIRYFIAAASALAIAATATSALPVHADEAPIDAYVAAGAAGLSAVVYEQSYDLAPLLGGKDYAILAVTKPVAIVEPRTGSASARAALLNQTVGQVSAKVARVEVKASRDGKPFAEASTVLTGVKINGKLRFNALETHCYWDRYGDATGSTTVVDANGTQFAPDPNTVVPIPGVGELTLNEQHTDPWYFYDTAGNEHTAFTKYVFGAHLRVAADLQPIYGTADVYLGFTSCDPVVLPNLSGLKVAKTPSD